MKRRAFPVVLSAVAVSLGLTSCGASFGVGYRGFYLNVTLPASPQPEPPLPVIPSTTPPGKNPILPAP